MDKEKVAMYVVIGAIAAGVIAFALYTLWNNSRTHDRHVERIKGSFSSSAVHADATVNVLG